MRRAYVRVPLERHEPPILQEVQYGAWGSPVPWKRSCRQTKKRQNHGLGLAPLHPPSLWSLPLVTHSTHSKTRHSADRHSTCTPPTRGQQEVRKQRESAKRGAGAFQLSAPFERFRGFF